MKKNDLCMNDKQILHFNAQSVLNLMLNSFKATLKCFHSDNNEKYLKYELVCCKCYLFVVLSKSISIILIFRSLACTAIPNNQFYYNPTPNSTSTLHPS